jgi:hypothetical protein
MAWCSSRATSKEAEHISAAANVAGGAEGESKVEDNLKVRP